MTQGPRPAGYTDAGDLSGDESDVVFVTGTLAQTRPELFGTADPKDGWTALMNVAVHDAVARTVTLPSYYARNPLHVCDASPLRVSY